MDFINVERRGGESTRGKEGKVHTIHTRTCSRFPFDCCIETVTTIVFILFLRCTCFIAEDTCFIAEDLKFISMFCQIIVSHSLDTVA